jgi:hypothetical protein
VPTFAATTLDDSQPPREFPLWSPWTEHSDVPEPLRKQIEAEVDRRWLIAGLNQRMGPLQIAFLVAGGTAFFLAAALSDEFWTKSFVMAALLMTLFGGFRWIARRRVVPQVRRALLEAGRCASCGYNLAGFAGDELVRCPECDAAWRLPTPVS